MEKTEITTAASPRSFKGQRWVNIILRTLHLFGIAGSGAAFLYQLPSSDWLPYMILTVITGVLMMLLETWSYPAWLLQLRGLSMILKIIILVFGSWFFASPLILLCVILISGLIAHAPGKVRYYILFRS